MLNRMRETIPNSNSPGEVGLSKLILAVKCSAASSLYTSSRQSPIEVDSFFLLGGGGGAPRGCFLPHPSPIESENMA